MNDKYGKDISLKDAYTLYFDNCLALQKETFLFYMQIVNFV